MSALICNNPFSIPSIDLDECIGTSLATINRNFQDLFDVNCLTNSELNLIKTDLQQLTSTFISISSFNFENQYPKLWVNFDGTTATPRICSVYFNNVLGISAIANILKYRTGYYGLSFRTAFPNISYCLIGSARQVAASACFVQPISSTAFYTTSADINVVTLSGTLIDSNYISIAIYSL